MDAMWNKESRDHEKLVMNVEQKMHAKNFLERYYGEIINELKKHFLPIAGPWHDKTLNFLGEGVSFFFQVGYI